MINGGTTDYKTALTETQLLVYDVHMYKKIMNHDEEFHLLEYNAV
jgi:hypothetical protein